MKTRQTSVATVVALSGKAVANVHRKHPVSIAVSMALLAAATSALAAETTVAAAENAGAQAAAPQDVPTTPAPDVKKARSGTDSAGTDQGPPQKAQLETIVITGVRESQERAIEV